MNQPTTKPYFIRALHEWCTDNGFTPHLVVSVGSNVRVPNEFVRDGQIVLNVSYEATGHLQMNNELITFQARFGGIPRDIVVPVGAVIGIYARENGVGMTFEVEQERPISNDGGAAESAKGGDDDEPRPPTGRPQFRVVK